MGSMSIVNFKLNDLVFFDISDDHALVEVCPWLKNIAKVVAVNLATATTYNICIQDLNSSTHLRVAPHEIRLCLAPLARLLYA